MGKKKENVIHNFELSMGENLRSGDVRNITHFNVKRDKLSPKRDSEDSSATTGAAFTLPAIQALEYAPFFSEWAVYGLGTLGTSGEGTIFEKANGGGGYTMAVDATWDDPTGNSMGTATYAPILFHYKDHLYGFQTTTGTSYLYRYGDLTTGGDWNSVAANLTYKTMSATYTDTAWPVHHSQDDVAYFFTDNLVHSLDSSYTWAESALTLPNDYYIQAAAEYGRYLAIGTGPSRSSQTGVAPLNPSYVYIWDRDSSLALVDAKKQLPAGRIIAMGEIQSRLIVVLDENVTQTDMNDRGTLRVYDVTTGSVTLLNTIESKKPTAFTPIRSIIANDKLYFLAGLKDEVGEYGGILSVDAAGRIQVEVVEESLTTPADIQSMIKYGDYWFYGHSNDGSLDRTSNTATYTFTSFLETGIYGDGYTTHRLLGASVSFESLPASATVTLEYKLPEDTTWTQLGTITSTGAYRLSVAQTNVRYKEIQFRIESTGGSVITGFKFQSEEIADDLYE